MAKEFPYFRWYPKDAESDDKYAAMDDSELGFFHRCLNVSWMNEGIPEDPDDRSRVLKVPREIADSRWHRVGRCFVKSNTFPGKLVNLRQEIEREHAFTVSKRASKSVLTRWGKRNLGVERTNNERNTDVERTNNERNTDVERTNNERNTTALARVAQRASGSDVDSSSSGLREVLPNTHVNSARAKVSDLNGQTSSRFDEFWGKYPLQVDKEVACRQFVSSVTIENETAMFSCLDRYLKSDQVDRGVVSKPAKWLQDQKRDKWQSNWPAPKPKNGMSPQASENGCPVCKIIPCVCYERQLAREAAANA